MTDQPTSPYPAIILTHLRAFGEQEQQFARSVEFFRAHGLADIFERYPDVDALAYQICGDAFSTEVKGDFAGVIVTSEHDDAHPANREAKRLIDALALAEEALWTEDSLDLAVLARRADENVEITVHDPAADPASRLLKLVETGEPIPAAYARPSAKADAYHCSATSSRRELRTPNTDSQERILAEDQNTPNPNDARADRAFAALRTAGAGETDVHPAAARILTDLFHVFQRHGVALHAVTREATETYEAELTSHGPVTLRALDLEPAPVEVVTIMLHGNNRYHSPVLGICGEFLDDADILVPLWDLLVKALIDGKASEDPGDISHRTFYVEVTQRPAVAAQLLALRSLVTSEGTTDPAALTEPDGGLAQFLD